MATQRVRPFVADDIPQVSKLHRTLYRANEEPTLDLEQSYRCFFQDVYLNNPWYDPRISPLICEEGNGKIIGFLGVMPRPLRLNGRPVQAATCSMFMVDPNHRFGLAAVQLLRTLLSGPQDLSFADESTGPSRKLWERMGGTTSMLYSMHWIRPLKPAGLLNVQLSQRSGMRALARISAPFCWAADTAMRLARLSPFRRSDSRLSGESSDPRTIIECSNALCDPKTLRPEYDEQSLGWLLDLASHGGGLETISVRNSSGKAVGWYVYHLSRERIAEVLQIGANPSFSQEVVDHLLNHAEQRGAVAVTGRLDPRFADAYESGCLMRPRYWMLLHSKRQELMSMLDRGEPFLTRLEGEWCMQFHIARYKNLIAEKSSSPAAPYVLTAPAPTVKAETGGVEVVDLLGDEWRRLHEESGCLEPFYRPEWVSAYLRAFAPEKKVVVVTARVGGVLRAVLPLVEERSIYCGVPITKLRGAANAHCCRFDMVRAPGVEGDEAVQAIWRFLRDLPGWTAIEFPYVPEGSALEGLTAAARLDGFHVGEKESMRSPYLPLSWVGAGQDPLVLQTTANFRATIRRRGRQIEGRGNLALRRVNTADPAMLQTFYDLEHSGWKGKEGTAIACGKDTRQFYDEIARHGERFGYLSLSFLDFNGQTIAAQFGVTYGGRYFMPKLAFDENYRQYGPGHLLIHALMRDCVEHGISEYDFTGPWAEYKAKWTLATRAHSKLTIFRKGLFGSLLHGAKFKVEPGVKKMVRPLRRSVTGNGRRSMRRQS